MWNGSRPTTWRATTSSTMRRHELRRDRRRVDLAETFEATVALELEEDEVAAAVARSRIADHEGADAGDPHGAAGGRCASWNVSTTSAIESTGTISVQAVPTMPSSAPATTSRVETPSPPEDAVEHERPTAQQREHPEHEAGRLVEVRHDLDDAEDDVDASDDAAEDGDPPRSALRRHDRPYAAAVAPACARTSASCAGLMLPPLQMSATRLPARRSRRRQRAGERSGAGRLHQVARGLDHRHDRRADLVVGDEHEIVEQVPHDPLRQLEGCARRESLGERLHAILEERALLPRPVRGRRRIGLDADHLDAGAHRLGGDARARRSAPAADGDDDHVDRRLVLEQLERRGRDASDQVRLVARVDVAVAVLGSELRAVLARLVEVASVRDDLRAERLHRRELHRIHALGHADDRAHAEQPRGVRDRLAVIAGRGRDHPSAALVAGELSHEVDAATHLERPDRQVVLVLHPHVGVDDAR